MLNSQFLHKKIIIILKEIFSNEKKKEYYLVDNILQLGK